MENLSNTKHQLQAFTNHCNKFHEMSPASSSGYALKLYDLMWTRGGAAQRGVEGQNHNSWRCWLRWERTFRKRRKEMCSDPWQNFVFRGMSVTNKATEWRRHVGEERQWHGERAKGEIMVSMQRRLYLGVAGRTGAGSFWTQFGPGKHTVPQQFSL